MIKIQKTVLASIIALMSGHLLATSSYEVIDLGKLDDKSIFAMGLNNLDTAVGYSYIQSINASGTITISPIHGYANQNGLITDLGAISNATTDNSIILDINDNDLAVGYSWQTVVQLDENGQPLVDSNGKVITKDFERGVYSSVGSGEMNIIPSFIEDDVRNMRALSVNNNGLIVGWGYYNPSDDLQSDGTNADQFLERPFFYDTTTDTLTRLDPVDYNGQVAQAVLRDVNNSGVAVGWSSVYFENNPYFKSFYVDINNPQQIIELPISSDSKHDTPFAINDMGKIVGKRNIDDSFDFTAFVFDLQSQKLVDIPVLVPGLDAERTKDNSIAYDINNLDQVVGAVIYDVVPDVFHAFLYENEQLVDLNNKIDCKIDPNAAAEGEPDWILTEARAINDNGVIVGNGLLNSEPHAFMLKLRDGVEAKTCKVVEVEKSGSGSFPLWLLVLLGGGAALKRRFKA